MSNCLVLMSDEHNPFYTQPYGHPSVRTPAMQALAERGAVYENSYCPSPLCMPSRSAFVAGKPVHELQAYSNCSTLVDRSPQSFGAALSAQGVYSAFIGKTDLYAPGRELGFDEMMRPGDRKPPGDTNHRRNPMSTMPGAAGRADGYGPKENACADDLACVERALQWLQDTAPGLAQPWVLIVNVSAPHFPHFAPPEFWNMYQDDGDLPDHGPACATAQHPYAATLRCYFQTHEFSERQIRGLRKGYLACISFVDHQLARLTEALSRGGLNGTINVIYASDHGEMLGKFGMWWKCCLYEDAARIPIIAAAPRPSTITTM